MRRVGVLFLFMLILILTAAPIDVAAADGYESSESLTSFSETLTDDAWLYPDSDTNLTFWPDAVAGWTGVGSGDSKTTTNDYTHTNSSDDSRYECQAVGSLTAEAYVYLNMSHSSAFYLTYIELEVASGSGDDSQVIYIYDFVAETYDQLDGTSFGTTDETREYAITGEEYTDSSGTSTIRLYSIDTAAGSAIANVKCDHAEAWWTETSPLGYSESFADVSEINATLGETVTTDGDLGTFHHPGDNAWDYYFWNAPSALAVQVIEWRCHANISSSSYEIAFYSADDGGGSQLWTSGSITAPTSAGTKKYSPMVTGIESIRLATRHASSPAAFIFDYLRAGKSTESGWAHDGSTTAGVDTVDNGAGAVFSLSTDDDILNMTVTRPAGSTGQVILDIDLDNTATSAKAEYDYYPFFKSYFSVSTSGCVVGWDIETDGYRNANTTTNSGWWIYRWNTKAFTVPNVGNRIVWWSSGFEVGDSFTILFDYGKLYSIANFTYTGSGVGVDDYLYTDSGVLHSNIDDGYIEMNHDPALSVSDTYSVYNLTTGSTAPEFSQYVSEWSAYSDETRGATTSGTVTDIKLKLDSIEILSAIKFIEDGTAPAVVRSSSTPNDPQDDESTTLSAVITDTVEVYTVKFNAIVYPTGFSDVDYSANEQSDNLWNYTFSSLDAGYYCFKIIASDGANTNALTEYAYIELTVREAQIRISTYTFFGASSDFTYMQYSGHISHDCTYNISEWSTTWAKNETHTGSVTEGMFNIAWDKIGVDDAEANFTIVFVSGTLSLTIDGYYGTAYKLLRITEIEVMNMEESLALTNITINFYTNKDVDWYVYDRDDGDALLSSGSSVEGSGDLYFLKNRIPYAHFYAVKWDDGVTQIWYNSSYWTYRQNVDSINPPGTDWGAKDQRKTIEFWVTATAIIGGLGLIVLGIMQYDSRQRLKALQLPRYKTQEREK